MPSRGYTSVLTIKIHMKHFISFTNEIISRCLGLHRKCCFQLKVSLLFKESHLNLSRKHQKGKPVLKCVFVQSCIISADLYNQTVIQQFLLYFSCSVWRGHSSGTTRFSSWMKQQHPLTWKQTISYRESSHLHSETKLSSLLL